MSIFEGMTIVLSTGDIGKIESSFGKSGKARLVFSKPLSEEAETSLAEGKPVTVNLHLKKYLHDKTIKSYVPEIVNS